MNIPCKRPISSQRGADEPSNVSKNTGTTSSRGTYRLNKKKIVNQLQRCIQKCSTSLVKVNA